jgi:predicted TIM-barrel fold metal-dependent hydrolase
MYPLYEKAAEWAVPVILDLRPLAHENPATSAHAIEQIGNDFPELSCILAHADFTAEQMLRLTDQLPNLHFSFDTASLLFPEVREFIRHEVGQSRSMWGSNGVPWKSAISELRRVGLPRRDAILKHNASRVFGLNSQAKQKARAYSQLAARDIAMRAE